ncbi:hypothetical protein [Candidatus Erwinia haradaeae]|uniref:hypothetical protein n=1 Tax=Candidatus Erwinia haradaeae TaxID=1922217 RepID=UPI0012FEDF8E|nr:hypothetical protein [Candidatus Erwinia haradaeae]
MAIDKGLTHYDLPEVGYVLGSASKLRSCMPVEILNSCMKTIGIFKKTFRL